MKKAVLSMISVIAVAFATLVATSACMFWSYQPKEPEILDNK